MERHRVEGWACAAETRILEDGGQNMASRVWSGREEAPRDSAKGRHDPPSESTPKMIAESKLPHTRPVMLAQPPPPPPAVPNGSNGAAPAEPPLDLVGGPFAVIESDPGVFTSLTRRLGIRHLELVELYDIEPWAVDHLNPHGLIFCFMWRKDAHRPADFDDPAAERVWFANQLSDDACATHAILNVVLNCPGVDVGEELRAFRSETEQMSPVMRGLAMTNSPILRQAHNSLARPADIRGALNAIATTTFDAAKKAKAQAAAQKLAARSTKPPPAKRAKVTPKGKEKEKEKEKAKEKPQPEEEEETYHFIGYVPVHGKVWELDGLKSGPLEVGELPLPAASSSSPSSASSAAWMDIARPALRMKMDKYGGSGNDGSNIRFSLLAIVDDMYEKASDELEFLKRDLMALEKRIEEAEALRGTWRGTVDADLLATSRSVFTEREGEAMVKGRTYAPDFAARRMQRDIEIMDMPERKLLSAWEECMRISMRAKVAVEDELAKAKSANKDYVKRTFDYEPFFREFCRHLQEEGLLDALLDLDEPGRKKAAKKGGGAKANG